VLRGPLLPVEYGVGVPCRLVLDNATLQHRFLPSPQTSYIVKATGYWQSFLYSLVLMFPIYCMDVGVCFKCDPSTDCSVRGSFNRLGIGISFLGCDETSWIWMDEAVMRYIIDSLVDKHDEFPVRVNIRDLISICGHWVRLIILRAGLRWIFDGLSMPFR
jgi:hypothetical protein